MERLHIEPTHAPDHAFDNTKSFAYGVVTARTMLFNANYAFAETRNLHQVVKIDVPIALVVVAILIC